MDRFTITPLRVAGQCGHVLHCKSSPQCVTNLIANQSRRYPVISEPRGRLGRLQMNKGRTRITEIIGYGSCSDQTCYGLRGCGTCTAGEDMIVDERLDKRPLTNWQISQVLCMIVSSHMESTKPNIQPNGPQRLSPSPI